jgi:hypothetical protein
MYEIQDFAFLAVIPKHVYELTVYLQGKADFLRLYMTEWKLFKRIFDSGKLKIEQEFGFWQFKILKSG